MDFNIKITNRNPKLSSNIISKLCFTWLIPLFRKGSQQMLNLSDLYDNLPADKSDTLGYKLEESWNHQLAMAKEKNKKPSLLGAIRSSFFWGYMLCGFLLFVQFSVIKPLQPVLLSVFIRLFTERTNDQNNEEQMYLYGFLIVSISFILSFFHHHVNLSLGRIGMRVRIACCSLMYRKMMRLSKKSLSQAAAGQVVNLMSNDVSRFDFVAIFLHHIWIMPIQAALVTYFIWQQVQISAIIGVGSLILLTIPVHTYFGKLSARLRLKIAQTTDKRVKKMAEIVSGIQVIKMYAWEKPFAKIVHDERIREIKIVALKSYLRGVIISSSVFLERTILFITVISYVLMGNVITPDKVFSMAQFFNLLQLTMAICYPIAITVGSETLISIKRIQEFLLLEEKPHPVHEKNISKLVRFKNVNASWVPDIKLLSNINIEIEPGTLCAVIGPVGAGKSSLLHLLLGELTPTQGIISPGGEISYSSQEPWLFASSVQKNILFGQKYDYARYKKVVKVCALERDFELFPHGDKTEVGERGVSLSGGQKARINLARAVYRDADVYFLDDPLSAVDTHVGKHLFQKCIVEYLRGKTRILVTHQLQYLKQADHIIVINDGKIEAQGTFQELSKGDLDFTKLLKAADETDEARLTKQRQRRESTVSAFSVKSQTSEDGDDYNASEEREEGITYQGASAYYEYFKAGGNVCVLLGLVIIFLLGQATSNISDLWLTYWTNEESIYHTRCTSIEGIDIKPLNSTIENNNKDGNIYYTATTTDDICNSIMATHTAIYIYTAIIIASIVVLIIRAIYFYMVAMNSSRNLHNTMFNRLLQAPMRFFDTNPSGRILNRFSRDIGMIDEILPSLMQEALQIFLVMIGILIMVSLTNVYMIAVAVVLGVAVFKLRGWYVANARNIKHLEGMARSPVFSHLTATLNGITTIRACAAESILANEFDLHQDTHTSVWYLTLACVSSFGLWLDVFSVIFIGCVIVGFIIMYVYGTANGSLVGLAISQAMILTGMVQYGLKQLAEVVSQMTSVERVLEYSKIEIEGSDTPSNNESPPETWPDNGSIKFVNVSLRYSPAEPGVLEDLNFTVNAGEKIGVVGRTGAGKSSLISALFRLAPLEGTIIIDDIDTQSISLIDLRKKISIIPQEPVLFSATLRYNLDPFNEFPDEELWNALEQVELKDVATSLDFYVEEGGSNFSVGQRQLICLARATLRNNKILILDEATANVDPQTDALIQKTIREKFSGCTVLTVAHRLHTIMDSDKVLVMDAGTIVEYDHPFSLLQNNKGYLYKMVAETGTTMTKQLHELAEVKFGKEIVESQNDEDTL